MDVVENYDIDTRVYIAQLNFDALVEETNLDRKYKPLPKYPAILRDIAVVVDSDVMVGELEKVILENGEGLIENIELFDVYEGKQIESGKKSVAFSLTYRSSKKTLKDEEVNKVHERIIEELERRLDAKLRS